MKMKNKRQLSSRDDYLFSLELGVMGVVYRSITDQPFSDVHSVIAFHELNGLSRDSKSDLERNLGFFCSCLGCETPQDIATVLGFPVEEIEAIVRALPESSVSLEFAIAKAVENWESVVGTGMMVEQSV